MPEKKVPETTKKHALEPVAVNGDGKKLKYSHLYEKIHRNPVDESVVPIEGPKLISKPCTVDVIGVSFSAGQPKAGAESGPSMMLQAGLIDQLEHIGWKVNCPERLPSYEHFEPAKADIVPHKLKNLDYVARVTHSVHEQVKKVCKQGNLALTLGGDHSIGMGTVSGSLAVYPNLGVIWVDAHADINTVESTDSGNIHGCPVSFLMGIGSKVKQFEWLKPCLKKNKIVYIGLRDVDAGEKKILKENKILAFSMHEVDKYGIGEIMKRAFNHIGNDAPIHLSFDVDALDPTVAPATGTAVRGGLTFREGHFICEEIFETGRLVAMDLMEVNPLLGESELDTKTTVNIGCSLIRAAMGESLL